MDEQPRPVATTPDTDYSLSIDDAAGLYQRSGLPRTLRTIQRYCAKGDLDCRRVEIPFGEKYFITKASVEKHIAYIIETRQSMVGHDEPRHVTAPVETERPGSDQPRQVAPGRDEPRQTAAESEMGSRYVAGLERENEFLRGQITVKDGQIKEMTERARETNVLIAGLQKMLTPLLGRPATRDDEARSHLFDNGSGGGIEQQPQ